MARALDIASVLAEVLDERERQNAKWGEQNHPDGTGPDVLLAPIGGRAGDAADLARDLCQAAAREGVCTWLAIAREEMFEAFAEADPAKLRTELVQSAAVLVQWVEAIDRRSTGLLSKRQTDT
jgi:hypothetical protein